MALARKRIYVTADRVREYSAYLNDHEIEFKVIIQDNDSNFYLNGEEDKLTAAEAFANKIEFGFNWFKVPKDKIEKLTFWMIAKELELQKQGTKVTRFTKRDLVKLYGHQGNLSAMSSASRHIKSAVKESKRIVELSNS